MDGKKLACRWISLFWKLIPLEFTVSLKMDKIFISRHQPFLINRHFSVKHNQKQIRVKLVVLHNRASWCELPPMLKHPCSATWIGSLSSGGLDKTVWIKYSWALLNRGFAAQDGPRASAECKAPARKQSHIWSMTMNLTEEKPALITEDQRQDLKKASEDMLCLVS